MTYNLQPHITGDTWEGIGLISFTRNNSALDLTNASLSMNVKPAYNLASPIYLSLTTQNSGITIIQPTSGGNVSVPQRVVDVPVGRYNWSLTLELSSGEISTYLNGNWPIIARTP